MGATYTRGLLQNRLVLKMSAPKAGITAAMLEAAGSQRIEVEDVLPLDCFPLGLRTEEGGWWY